MYKGAFCWPGLGLFPPRQGAMAVGLQEEEAWTPFGHAGSAPGPVERVQSNRG